MKTFPILPIDDVASTQSHNSIDANSTCASSALVALQVLDASMAPELNANQVIIVDCTGRLQDESLVLVEADDRLLIRCWRPVSEDHVELRPLNPLWKTQCYATSEVQLKGVVVQRNGRRRRDRKRYV